MWQNSVEFCSVISRCEAWQRGSRQHLWRVVVSAIYFLPFDKVWLNFVCWRVTDIHVRSLAMKYNAELTEGVRKLWSYFKPSVDQVHEILRRCRRPLAVSNALSRLSISCFVPKILTVKIAVKLRSRRKASKIGGLGPPIFKGIPQILDMHFRTALTSEHVAVFSWVPFSELGG